MMQKMTSHSNIYLQKAIIEDESFVWSYSRLKKYEDCKYAWYLTYMENCEDEGLFFSQYGSFIHDLYCKVLMGELPSERAYETYLSEFREKVSAPAPTPAIFSKYFSDGLMATKKMNDFYFKIISEFEIMGVEIKVDFNFGDKNFVGFIDLLLKDEKGNYIIVDHKSKTIKPKETKVIDKYTRQLYVYAEAVKQKYGKYPKELWLHCFRNEENDIIKTPFDLEKLPQTAKIFNEMINEIANTEKWTPNINPFYCKNLCGCNKYCDYYQMMKGH